MPTSEEHISAAHDLGDEREAEQSAADEDAVEDDADDFAKDPFRPFNDLGNETQNILTVRAMVVGVLCGALVNTSNIYLGLKSGWTAGANIFAVGLLSFTFSTIFTH